MAEQGFRPLSLFCVAKLSNDTANNTSHFQPLNVEFFFFFLWLTKFNLCSISLRYIPYDLHVAFEETELWKDEGIFPRPWG